MGGSRGAVAALTFAAAVVLVGCSGDDRSGDVSGTVTYDGKPVEDGHIKFIAADGQGTADDVIKSGKYTVRKAPVGNTKVSISGVKVTGQKKMYDTPDSPTVPVVAELLPAKYNDKTELTFEVKRGSNEKNWELAK